MESLRSGEEDVHPAWLKWWKDNKLALVLVDYLRPDDYAEIEQFFANLQYPDIVRSMNPAGMKISFVLGAGASKPAPSDIPTVRELLPQLLERARRLDREDVTKLADFCEQLHIHNIEDLLTAAQLATFCSRNTTVLRLMDYLLYRRDSEEGEQEDYPFAHGPRRAYPTHAISKAVADVASVAFLQDTLQILFGLLASTMLPAEPNAAHESIAEYANTHSGASIVTTNYDCCMDMALEDVNQPFSYCIEFGNTHHGKAARARPTQLIKLHGSLNWYYCETCQEVHLVSLKTILRQYAKDTVPYPVIGICKSCRGQRRCLLVPPLAMKFDMAPPLTPLIEEAKKSFDSADLIVVVGFSFAEADVYISRMLSKSMQTNAKQKLLVVDPEVEVVARVRRKFKASIPDFDEDRIMPMYGDCAELLPKFLSGEIHKEKGSAARAGSAKSRRKKRKSKAKK